MTTQTTQPHPVLPTPPGADAARLEQIRNSMDPLAIVGVFLYYIIRDLTGYEFSQDTLLWFIAAAASARSFVSKWIDRKIAERREEREHQRMLAQAAMMQAARKATEAAQRMSGVMKAIAANNPGAVETQGTGESQIREIVETSCD